MNLLIKRTHPMAITPFYAKEGDAGLDLTAVEITEVISDAGINQWKINTGIAVKIPEGYVGLLFPRSSCSKLKNRLANAVGVIDSGYVGTIFMMYDSYGKQSGPITTAISEDVAMSVYPKTRYEVGDRVGQLVIVPCPKFDIQEVDELPTTDRGEGGFGSTGK